MDLINLKDKYEDEALKMPNGIYSLVKNNNEKLRRVSNYKSWNKDYCGTVQSNEKW